MLGVEGRLEERRRKTHAETVIVDEDGRGAALAGIGLHGAFDGLDRGHPGAKE